MPLTPFQKTLAKLLSKNRTPDSHLAGGAALHFQAHSIRFSNDLDYFHDTLTRVTEAFSTDQKDLLNKKYKIEIEIQQPGYIKATVSKNNEATKVEWCYDSNWRFLPAIKNPDLGYVLHPLDLAINKVLALAGRNEPRDFLDVIHVHNETLPLGALCWAAAGKDPGFTPLSLLELLRRRGKYQESDFKRLKLNQPIDLKQLKTDWLKILETAENFINSRPGTELGALYYSKEKQDFIAPGPSDKNYQVHYGQPGGILPKIL